MSLRAPTAENSLPSESWKIEIVFQVWTGTNDCYSTAAVDHSIDSAFKFGHFLFIQRLATGHVKPDQLCIFDFIRPVGK